MTANNRIVLSSDHAAGDCRLGVILCGAGQGVTMAANRLKGIRCGV